MTDFSAESFFSSHPPPEGLDETLESLEEFIAFHVQAQRKVVLVTVSPLYLCLLVAF